MAETERRSKPRKVEPKEDEETEPKGHGLVLLAYLVASVAVIEVMFVVASFLSAGKADNMVLYVLGATALVSAILFAAGKFIGRKK
ncbi:MAG: hypothetical protein V4510_05770 [bacterium]